jgi:hypothetical protein
MASISLLANNPILGMGESTLIYNEIIKAIKEIMQAFNEIIFTMQVMRLGSHE